MQNKHDTTGHDLVKGLSAEENFKSIIESKNRSDLTIHYANNEANKALHIDFIITYNGETPYDVYFDVKAKSMKLFIAGLSNETAAIDHPVAKDEAGRPIKVFLRKTLELSYALGGDATLRSNANLIYKGKRWVMR